MKSRIKELKGHIEQCRNDLIKIIDELPDSDSDIKMLSHNSCTVPLSVIAANRFILSPSYYLSHEAKQVLKKVITNARVENIEAILDRIVDQGFVENKYEKIVLNRSLIRELKKKWSV